MWLNLGFLPSTTYSPLSTENKLWTISSVAPNTSHLKCVLDSVTLTASCLEESRGTKRIFLDQDWQSISLCCQSTRLQELQTIKYSGFGCFSGGNHTPDCCATLRQFYFSSTIVKRSCWLFSTCCSHSQMSIRENLEMEEGLYVCRAQGQFSVAAVSWWHRLILTQPTFLPQNHKVKAPGALLPFSIRYEFFSPLY